MPINFLGDKREKEHVFLSWKRKKLPIRKQKRRIAGNPSEKKTDGMQDLKKI